MEKIASFSNVMENTEHVSFKAVIILKTIKMKNRDCISTESMKMKQPLVIKVGSTVTRVLSLTSVSGFLFLEVHNSFPIITKHTFWKVILVEKKTFENKFPCYRVNTQGEIKVALLSCYSTVSFAVLYVQNT